MYCNKHNLLDAELRKNGLKSCCPKRCKEIDNGIALRTKKIVLRFRLDF